MVRDDAVCECIRNACLQERWPLLKSLQAKRDKQLEADKEKRDKKAQLKSCMIGASGLAEAIARASREGPEKLRMRPVCAHIPSMML